MFYSTDRNDHGLPYNPFKACIIPRPIAWISSSNAAGVVNIAPYSYFNAVSDIPPIIMFASAYKADGENKDSLRNILELEEFVVNLVPASAREVMNLSSTPLPYGVSEAQEFKINTTPSSLVKPPRIAISPINLECRYLKTVSLEVEGKEASSQIILGHVIGVHIDDQLIVDGKLDVERWQPLARLGYKDYTIIEKAFEMPNMAKPK
jgi:flavin reductase (DIM6/NTAB) family NADH-FMN oxidoreductase RutF